MDPVVAFIAIIAAGTLAFIAGRRLQKLNCDIGNDQTPPPQAAGIVILTPRRLERVNIRRKIDNKPPLNRLGFQRAMASAPSKMGEGFAMDYMLYLIDYETRDPAHHADLVAVDYSIEIDTTKPFNGQEGYGTWQRQQNN